MAGIEKIYGTPEQRRELKRFIRRLRLEGHVKRAMFRCFYPVGFSALTNFDCWMDRLLWKQPYLPAWVKARIQWQYNGSSVSESA